MGTFVDVVNPHSAVKGLMGTVFDVVRGDIVFDVVNPFPCKGFPIDE